MIVFPNSKINLGLRIHRKKRDGYHDIETIFYPIPLTGILEITRGPQLERKEPVPFTKSGFIIEGDPSDNLCIRAFKALKKDFPQISNIKIHLHKGVPSGAGLGGGSADAAFTLMLLNKEFKLGLSDDQLIGYTAKLGSDCPFFIINKPRYATGRGEKMEPIAVDLSDYKIMIVNPGIHINTGKAFLKIKPAEPLSSLKEIIAKPIARWKDDLVNDFEVSVFAEYPEIVTIKDDLYIQGAIYASLSGSGSTVYGIFPKEKDVSIAFPEKYFVKELHLDKT